MPGWSRHGGAWGGCCSVQVAPSQVQVSLRGTNGSPRPPNMTTCRLTGSYPIAAQHRGDGVWTDPARGTPHAPCGFPGLAVAPRTRTIMSDQRLVNGRARIVETRIVLPGGVLGSLLWLRTGACWKHPMWDLHQPESAARTRPDHWPWPSRWPRC